MFLLLLFITIPAFEIYLFIKVGAMLGAGNTFLLILLTVFIGTYLVKQEGISILAKAQQKLQEDKTPTDEMFSGICILIAGLLLITPGFFTDIIGLLLLNNWFRMFLKEFILDSIVGSFTYGFADFQDVRDAKGKVQDKAKEKFNNSKNSDSPNKPDSEKFKKKGSSAKSKKSTSGKTIEADFKVINKEDNPE